MEGRLCGSWLEPGGWWPDLVKALGIEPGLDAGVWVGCKEERTTQTHCAGSVWWES